MSRHLCWGLDSIAEGEPHREHVDRHPILIMQELVVVKAESASRSAEVSKTKQQCSELQSQNAAMAIDLKHHQRDLAAAQVLCLP